jgi:glycosyltransferase involved in cell wall biosynthesis
MLSVALASCNGERYVVAQVQSILAQLDAEDELVVSDDASSDATVAVLNSLGEPRLRIVQNSQRVGYVKNFERAIKLCRGDFVFLSDQDDIWLPGKVDKLISCLERVSCAASDARVVNEDLGTINASFFALRRTRSFSPMAIFLRPSIIGATIACRRSFLNRLMPFPERAPHDFWITLNAALMRQMEVLPEPLILYRRHGATASLSTGNTKRSIWSIFRERFVIARSLLRTVAHRQQGGARSR